LTELFVIAMSLGMKTQHRLESESDVLITSYPDNLVPGGQFYDKV